MFNRHCSTGTAEPPPLHALRADSTHRCTRATQQNKCRSWHTRVHGCARQRSRGAGNNQRAFLTKPSKPPWRQHTLSSSPGTCPSRHPGAAEARRGLARTPSETRTSRRRRRRRHETLQRRRPHPRDPPRRQGQTAVAPTVTGDRFPRVLLPGGESKLATPRRARSREPHRRAQQPKGIINLDSVVTCAQDFVAIYE